MKLRLVPGVRSVRWGGKKESTAATTTTTETEASPESASGSTGDDEDDDHSSSHSFAGDDDDEAPVIPAEKEKTRDVTAVDVDKNETSPIRSNSSSNHSTSNTNNNNRPRLVMDRRALFSKIPLSRSQASSTSRQREVLCQSNMDSSIHSVDATSEQPPVLGRYVSEPILEEGRRPRFVAPRSSSSSSAHLAHVSTSRAGGSNSYMSGSRRNLGMDSSGHSASSSSAGGPRSFVPCRSGSRRNLGLDNSGHSVQSSVSRQQRSPVDPSSQQDRPRYVDRRAAMEGGGGSSGEFRSSHHHHPPRHMSAPILEEGENCESDRPSRDRRAQFSGGTAASRYMTGSRRNLGMDSSAHSVSSVSRQRSPVPPSQQNRPRYVDRRAAMEGGGSSGEFRSHHQPRHMSAPILEVGDSRPRLDDRRPQFAGDKGAASSRYMSGSRRNLDTMGPSSRNLRAGGGDAGSVASTIPSDCPVGRGGLVQSAAPFSRRNLMDDQPPQSVSIGGNDPYQAQAPPQRRAAAPNKSVFRDSTKRPEKNVTLEQSLATFTKSLTNANPFQRRASAVGGGGGQQQAGGGYQEGGHRGGSRASAVGGGYGPGNNARSYSHDKFDRDMESDGFYGPPTSNNRAHSYDDDRDVGYGGGSYYGPDHTARSRSYDGGNDNDTDYGYGAPPPRNNRQDSTGSISSTGKPGGRRASFFGSFLGRSSNEVDAPQQQQQPDYGYETAAPADRTDYGYDEAANTPAPAAAARRASTTPYAPATRRSSAAGGVATSEQPIENQLRRGSASFNPFQRRGSALGPGQQQQQAPPHDERNNYNGASQRSFAPVQRRSSTGGPYESERPQASRHAAAPMAFNRRGSTGGSSFHDNNVQSSHRGGDFAKCAPPPPPILRRSSTGGGPAAPLQRRSSTGGYSGSHNPLEFSRRPAELRPLEHARQSTSPTSVVSSSRRASSDYDLERSARKRSDDRDNRSKSSSTNGNGGSKKKGRPVFDEAMLPKRPSFSRIPEVLALIALKKIGGGEKEKVHSSYERQCKPEIVEEKIPAATYQLQCKPKIVDEKVQPATYERQCEAEVAADGKNNRALVIVENKPSTESKGDEEENADERVIEQKPSDQEGDEKEEVPESDERECIANIATDDDDINGRALVVIEKIPSSESEGDNEENEDERPIEGTKESKDLAIVEQEQTLDQTVEQEDILDQKNESMQAVEEKETSHQVQDEQIDTQSFPDNTAIVLSEKKQVPTQNSYHEAESDCVIPRHENMCKSKVSQVEKCRSPEKAKETPLCKSNNRERQEETPQVELRQTNSTSRLSSKVPPNTRDMRLEEVIAKAKKTKTKDLKLQLAFMGIKTESFVEKSDFVKAYAEAVVDREGMDEATESSFLDNTAIVLSEKRQVPKQKSYKYHEAESDCVIPRHKNMCRSKVSQVEKCRSPEKAKETPLCRSNNRQHQEETPQVKLQQTYSTSRLSSKVPTNSRDFRLEEETAKAKTMKSKDLKLELALMDIKTESFVEKSDFVKAYAEAVVDRERMDEATDKAQSMKIKDLKQQLTAMGIAVQSFVEKSEYVNAYARAVVDREKERKHYQQQESQHSSSAPLGKGKDGNSERPSQPYSWCPPTKKRESQPYGMTPSVNEQPRETSHLSRQSGHERRVCWDGLDESKGNFNGRCSHTQPRHSEPRVDLPRRPSFSRIPEVIALIALSPNSKDKSKQSRCKEPGKIENIKAPNDKTKVKIREASSKVKELLSQSNGPVSRELMELAKILDEVAVNDHSEHENDESESNSVHEENKLVVAGPRKLLIAEKKGTAKRPY